MSIYSHMMRVIVAGSAFLLLTAGNGFATDDLLKIGETFKYVPPEARKPAVSKPTRAAAPVVKKQVRRSAAIPSGKGLWITPAGDASRGLALIEVLRTADAQALPSGRYRPDALAAAIEAASGGDEALVAKAEQELMNAFITYARDLHGGVVEPSSVDRDIDIVAPVPNEALLVARLATKSPVTILKSVAPSNMDYDLLVRLLAKLRATKADAWGPEVPDGPSLKPGERSPRVAAVRARLIGLRFHIDDGAVPDVYDPALEASVRVFQERSGLNSDGVIGSRTIRAMNVSLDERIGQVMVNLERLRWNNRPEETRYIDVNQADFTVKLVDRGQVVFHERVVIGAPRHRTPEFSETMKYLVFNPTWHVPRSIAKDEILAGLQRDPEYMSKRGMRLVSRSGEPAPDPSLVDWSVFTPGSFPWAVKQRPGDGNALGRVKFMFPNCHAIYLHDTPSKRLFAKDARAFSHGCIRVQDPMRLAEALLSLQESDPAGKISRLLATGKERTVHLNEPVPVHLEYRTVLIAPDGRAEFRADIYGRDAKLLTALRQAGVGEAYGG